MTAPEDPGPNPKSEDDQIWEPDPPAAAPTTGPRLRVVPPKPEVRGGLNVYRIVQELQAALGHPTLGDPLLFQRPHELVAIARTVAVNSPIATGSPVIRPLIAADLVARITRYVRYIRPLPPKKDGAQREPIPGLPPPPVVGALLGAPDWPSIRPLQGLSETPFLRPDGSVCQEPGYDLATGYLFLPNAEYPKVEDKPTQDDARAALARLEALLALFPHVSRAAKMVPIAALLTLLARPMVKGAIPLFAFDASTRGSGKTLQADFVALVATGRSASRATFPEDDPAELEKILSSYALAGSRLILLDNVTSALGGAPLDKALTAVDDVDMRILGRTEIRRLPWTALVMASGNNLTLGQDTLRRTLLSRLESPLERPEDRDDVPDLPEQVRSERPALVAAALTILRSYVAHGSPHAGCKTWGSYTAWARLIPHALVFAGGADVLDARPSDDRATLGDLDSLAVFLAELPRVQFAIGAAALTTKRILDTCYPAPKHGEPPDGWDDLREAIEAACPSRSGPPSSKALGHRLRKWQGRVLGGKRIASIRDRTNMLAWAVETLNF